MKIVNLLGGLLPLLLVACGGDKPANPAQPKTAASDTAASNVVATSPESGKSEASKSADDTSANDKSANDAAAAISQHASVPADAIPAAPSDSAAALDSAAEAPQAPQDPQKRIRRPRVNYKQFQILLGNDPPAPKAPVASTPELVALGKTLYHTKALSQKGNISCASCHDLSTYGVDNKPVSPGSAGSDGTRNSPTVYNAARQFRQFWDGRAESVEDQAIMPMINPIEHGLADAAAVVAKINEQADLVAGFQKAFPGQDAPVTAENFGIAIGAFERTLVTRSKWDDYIEKDQKALDNLELLGLQTFTEVGCNTCHMTKLLGGSMYQKRGVYKPYTGKDTARMEVTKSVADKYMFKVPSLLNVEMTAPYYHDGSVKTLEEAVNLMATEQLNKTLNAEQVEAIVAFLKALTGKLPEEFAKK